MNIVYEVSTGCIYEGGRTDLITASLTEALKYVHSLRKKEIDYFFVNRDIIEKALCGRSDQNDYIYERKGRHYWVNRYEYIRIKEWVV